MDCLKSKIQYRYCAGEDEKGVLYINDLPGLSTLLLSDLTTVERPDFDKVFKSIQNRVLTGFKAKIERAMAVEYNVSYELYKSPEYMLQRPVKFTELMEPVSQIFIVPTGRNTTAKFNKVTFFAFDAYTGATIELIDLLTGDALVTLNALDFTKGFNQVELDYIPDNYFSENMYAIRLIAENLQLAPFYTGSACDCGCNNTLFSYPGIVPDNMLFDGVVNTGVQYLAVDFEYYCDVEKYICTNQNIFLNGLWYEFGAEILEEALNSDRVTWAVQGNRTQKETTRDGLYEYSQMEIARSIKKIPFGELCADCFGKNGSYSIANIKQ